MAALTHWRCLDCPASGSYVEPDTKTDTGPAAKHVQAEAHTTVTSTREWAGAVE